MVILVANSFTHIEGEDFNETFTPVGQMITLRSLLNIAVTKGRHSHQLDVSNYFLHDDLMEKVYMNVP